MLVAQLHPFLTPMGCSLPGSSVHGILQARILEWVAMPTLGDLPDPGIRPKSPVLQADSLPSEPPGTYNSFVDDLTLYVENPKVSTKKTIRTNGFSSGHVWM